MTTITILTEEMEKLGTRILTDLESFLVESDGNLKDTEVGTHIKIPLGAGYVSLWKSQKEYSMTLYLKQSLMEPQCQDTTLENHLDLNHDDET